MGVKALSVGMIAGFGLSRTKAALMAASLMALAIIPLLAMAQMRAGPAPVVPLLGDAATLVRIFIVLPLMVMAAPQFSDLIREAMDQPMRLQLIPDAVGKDYRKWRDALVGLIESPLVALICLGLAIVSSVLRPMIPGPLVGLSHWGADASGHLNIAGTWHSYIVTPILRFIILMWLWRVLMWVISLWRLPAFHLQLQPAHPDGAAGIGYLGFVQQRLSVLLVALSSMLAGSAANRIIYLHESVTDVALPILVYIVFYSVLLIAPLFLISPLLLQVKRQAILEYGKIGQELARDFQAAWVEGEVSNPLESPNPSAMADFGAVHSTVRDMAIIPIRTGDLGRIMLSCCGPFVFLVFIFVPLDVLVKSALAEIPPMELIAKASHPEAADDAPNSP